MKKFYTLLTLLILPALVGVVYFDLLNITPKPMNFLYNSNGDIMKSSPFAPSFKALFGVDAASKNMLFEVLSGYRITLLIIIVISSLSVLCSIVMGTYLAFNRKTTSIYSVFSNALFYIPQSILAYILLQPLLYETIDGFTTTMQFRMTYNIIILTILMIPTTTMLIKESTQHILNQDYIEAAYTISPNDKHIFIKQVLPNIQTQYLIIFLRICFQTLLVMTHLAFFKIFFGGTKVCYGPACEIIERPSINDLSSLLGFHSNELTTNWWTFYAPLVGILYIFIIINLMSQELKRSILKY
ncbi:ABC transporter permease subunit [Mammaliicoccus sciuri]|uniref:ABC transporter permease subunit n=2 Tax=Mammaliicoccus sciuri TaxID=1296 RepID=UPI0008785446|nr:ABC transporter permease subunit [Mammaliicoccus sciuri]MBG9204451.1 ABC transporter permease subunit [Mammaliicoccus sciuri]MBU6089831.1 ABC transporter permease subunit [Mammaliicoccus sciuri]MBW3107973.1 ABC transporter permease subunit [Mammaliicoccus sciuri]MCD8824136.1 ABC transporter permease subunit [Mammaliicoccus sciuri]MCD8847302.1 ABC transporter permease subunit [Mammaliicoccus sciuri]